MATQVSRVAVIGAGVSGVATAKHLKDAGIEVVVYERSSKAGGNWIYDPRTAPESPYPHNSPLPSKSSSLDTKLLETIALSKLDSDNPKSKDEIEVLFAPPGPAYKGLRNNVSTAMQELKGFPWPEGTRDIEEARVSELYIQAYAKWSGVEDLIKFGNRVDRVEKRGGKWLVEISELGYEDGAWGLVGSVGEFDAVVVASGHYHTINVPDIPGLKEWKEKWPERVMHSKGYRKAVGFEGQNVLVIGGGVSAMDITREILPTANKVYHSVRGGAFDLPAQFFEKSLIRISEVESFSLPTAEKIEPGTGLVTLKNGDVIKGIDRVILCTGYHQSRPFLSYLHAPTSVSDDKVLVTDGTMLHNLHKDIFYIPDPRLAFVGVPYYTSTFTFFEFQGIVVARVFAGRLELPGEKDMRREYDERVKAKGKGRAFHSLKDGQVDYVKELVEWVNGSLKEGDEERINGFSEAWFEKLDERTKIMREVLEGKVGYGKLWG